MSINDHFGDTITVQSATAAFGGGLTFTTRGTCKGYRRILQASEMMSENKPTLFATHRFAMSMDVVPVFGNYLLHNGIEYRVKTVDSHDLSGGGFQTVDAEVVT